jgi:hypothetical protein
MKIRSNIAISDSGFVFDAATGESYSFNPTGLEVFRYLKENKDYKEIAEIITNRYDVDVHSFERFYTDFMASLKQYHLLENE